MPLVWKVDPANSLVVAMADGDVTRAEMDGLLDAIADSRTLLYRKVFDVHRGDTAMTADDVLPLAVRMRAMHQLGPMGPLALILPAGKEKLLERALGMLAAAERPLKIFEDPARVATWIARQDVAGAAQERADGKTIHEPKAEARARAKHIRQTMRAVGAEAREARLGAERVARAADPLSKDREVLYRGKGDITYRGTPLNICVKRAGPSWEFGCCRADGLALGTLLILEPDEIAALRSAGHDPLKAALSRIKGLAQAGALTIPDIPSGAP